MPAAVRSCAVLVAAVLLSACASVPAATSRCGPASAGAAAVDAAASALAWESSCAAVAVAGPLQTVGGVQQRGGQTRTVGVPRGFLVTMIVLLVIFALA